MWGWLRDVSARNSCCEAAAAARPLRTAASSSFAGAADCRPQRSPSRRCCWAGVVGGRSYKLEGAMMMHGCCARAGGSRCAHSTGGGGRRHGRRRRTRAGAACYHADIQQCPSSSRSCLLLRSSSGGSCRRAGRRPLLCASAPAGCFGRPAARLLLPLLPLLCRLPTCLPAAVSRQYVVDVPLHSLDLLPFVGQRRFGKLPVGREVLRARERAVKGLASATGERGVADAPRAVDAVADRASRTPKYFSCTATGSCCRRIS